MPRALATSAIARRNTFGLGSSRAAARYSAITSSLSRYSEASNGAMSIRVFRFAISRSIRSFLQRARYLLRALDIRLLCRLVPARQQQVDGEPTANEVDPIARSEIDAHLGDARADGLAVTKVPSFGA